MAEISIGENSKIAPSAKLFGKVKLGHNVFIDDYVQIGYPLFSIQDVEIMKDVGHDEFMNTLSLGALTEIGDNCIIRSGSQIYAGSKIGAGFDCGHNANIRENCTIGEGCYVKTGTEVRKNVTIGRDCTISGIIGDHANLESGVTSQGYIIHEYRTGQRGENEPAPILQKNCFVGRGALVIGGIIIGQYAQIGGGAIVTKSVAAHSQVKGKAAQEFPNLSTLAKRYDK